jgi:chaperonin GroES
MAKFTPLGNRILIEELAETNITESGLIIPDTVAKIYKKGIVRYKSDEVTKVAVGDKILFPFNVGNPLNQDGIDMLLMDVNAVDAII